ncbi:hypothetical protein E2C01_021172 [Portunus trituberculatus]|uniref:Uncharacterized protein n=1 Tax=Portunus trituberculatus TaxID=210409 RepID=A0A5B7E3H9_PORTR|nr:hypothetical protein [Portunus trituberculatus]
MDHQAEWSCQSCARLAFLAVVGALLLLLHARFTFHFTSACQYFRFPSSCHFFPLFSPSHFRRGCARIW